MKRLALLAVALALFVAPCARAQSAYVNATLTASDPGTCTATNAGCAVMPLAQGSASVAFAVSGNAGGNTLQFEGTVDNTAWVSVSAYPPNSTTAATSTTGTGTWTASVSGMAAFRVRISTLVSGSAVVGMRNTTAISTSSRLSGGGGGGSGVTAVTGTSPIVSSGGATPVISCPTCSTSNAFSALTSSTNTTAAMICGTGCSITTSGSGSNSATKLSPPGTPTDCMQWGASGAPGDFGQPCGAGAYSSAISSTTYVTRTGGRIFDAGFSNTSQTVTFPNNDCPTYAQIGDTIFGTNHPATFSGNGTVIVPEGTITAGCALATGTLVVTVAANNNCVPSSSNICEIDFGPIEDTGLTNFESAYLAAPNCTPGVIAAGIYLVEKGHFNLNPTSTGLCQVSQGTSFSGPTVFGVAGFYGTVIVPTPNFDTTTGSGNSCGGGVSHLGCFLSSASMYVKGLSIWGAGQSRSGDTSNFQVVDLNGGTPDDNTYVEDLFVGGWAALAPFSWGIHIENVSAAGLVNVIDNAGGGVACVFNAPVPISYVAATNVECDNGGAASGNGGGGTVGALLVINGIWNSTNSTYGTVSYSSNATTRVIELQSGSVFSSTNDLINGVISNGTGYHVLVDTGGVANIVNGRISDLDSTNANNYGVYVQSGGIARLQNTKVDINAASSGVALDTNSTTAVLNDGGGNTISGTAANVIAAGTLKGGLFVLQTAPTIASGFGTGASVASGTQPSSFTINVGTSNTGTGVLTLPAAPTGWSCSATDTTTTSTTVSTTKVVPTSATSVTFQNYTDISGTHAWVDSDILSVSCSPYL